MLKKAEILHAEMSKKNQKVTTEAILTQNTSWKNVEKAIFNLKQHNALSPKTANELDTKTFASAIRPAGYFNQKTKKLKIFTEFYMKQKGKTPTRYQLLVLWGIGPETADSILLYAYKVPTFVVDAYTKRIFGRIGIIKKDSTYDKIKNLFELNLSPEYIIYNEYHALIVEHAKRFCKTKPDCNNCPLREICKLSSD